MPSIRVATIADAKSVLDIYAPFCTESSAVSFETVIPSLSEIEERIDKTLPRFPWLICQDETGVLGYAYAGEHKARAAYKWCTDVSIYLHENARGKGIGKTLYACLFDLLRRQGFYNAYGGITLPNPASLALHKAMGFTDVGVYKNVGYKCGAWHDVIWLALELNSHELNPSPPVHFSTLSQQELSSFLTCAI